MRRSFWTILILAGAFALWWAQTDGLVQVPGVGQPSGQQSSERHSPMVVRNVSVRDLDGRVAWRGDMDLGPALTRIERGQRDPHRNDGGIFQNRERRLPQRPRGHYREYVVRTPGISHAGPQRLVIGADGEVYYTADHYQSFQRLR